MSYITKIFERADLQNIRAFLLEGVEVGEFNAVDYRERIESATEGIVGIVRQLCPQEEKQEALINQLCCHLSDCEGAYMELGLQAGAVLANQLTGGAGGKRL